MRRNNHPEEVVEREVQRFIDNRAQRATRTEESPMQERQTSTATHSRFIALPFVSQKAEGFAKRLKGLVNNYYPQVDFNVAFKAPDEIGKHFPYKDSIRSKESRSLVIYKIVCEREGCNATYIGKTERILCHRIKEHKKSSDSACHQHEIENPGHRMCYENVEIIDSASSDFKLRCKELLHIVHSKPSLNCQLGAQSNYNIRTLIIAAHPQCTGGASTP